MDTITSFTFIGDREKRGLIRASISTLHRKESNILYYICVYSGLTNRVNSDNLAQVLNNDYYVFLNFLYPHLQKGLRQVHGCKIN